MEDKMVVLQNKRSNDVKEIIKESHQLTKKDVTYNIYRRLWQSILRFFAPFF